MLIIGLVLYMVPWFITSVWVPIRIRKNDETVREATSLERIALSMWWPVWVLLWAAAWLAGL